MIVFDKCCSVTISWEVLSSHISFSVTNGFDSITRVFSSGAPNIRKDMDLLKQGQRRPQK